MATSNRIPRQSITFSMTAMEGKRLRITMMDRINIDDIMVHMLHRHLHEIVAGQDHGVDIPRGFKDTLVRERYNAR